MWSGRLLATILGLATAEACAAPRPAPPPTVGCRSDLRLVLGACVSPAIARQACGPASLATADGCAVRQPCGPGRARDLATGDCLARREVRGLASSLGILVQEDQTLVCPGGGELATGEVDEGGRGPRLGCLPPAGASPVTCPRGSVRGDDGCVRFQEPDGRTDVVRWLRAVIGPDGGTAAPPLCSALRRSAGALAVPASVDVRVEVDLAFPDNDLTQVVVSVRGAGAGTVELEHVVAPMVEALRSAGGTANQTSIATAVRCRRASERPAVSAVEPGEPQRETPR